MTDLFDLRGRNALVTGANTGLGQAMAVALAGAGAGVVLVGRTAPTETVSRIESLGSECRVVMADLAEQGAVEHVIREASASLGPIDVLVNNAGIIRRADAVELTEADWDDVLNVNLKVPFLLAQGVARHMMAESRPGRIINVASLLSLQGGIRVASYTASKSGLAGLTRVLANEWAAHGINVNAIAPGYFATSNTEALRQDPQRSAEILGRIPAGRWGDPADLSGAVVFLASRASDYVHGVLLPVDGGWLAR